MWSGFAAMEAAKRDIIERKSRYKIHTVVEDSPPPYQVTEVRPPPYQISTVRVKPHVPMNNRKKQAIPKTVRNAVWARYFPNTLSGVCQCCKIEAITYGNFHAGHVISEHNGGGLKVDNLRPVCPLCNSSMGTQNMDEFIAKYGF